jgi:hypothetical protein
MVQLSTLLALAVSTLAVSSKPVAIDSGMSSAKLSIGTNAERIAQGMSPLPPTKRSTGMFSYFHQECSDLQSSCQGQEIFPS